MTNIKDDAAVSTTPVTRTPIAVIAERVATRKTRVQACLACGEPSLPGDKFCSDDCYNDYTADSTP